MRKTKKKAKEELFVEETTETPTDDILEKPEEDFAEPTSEKPVEEADETKDDAGDIEPEEPEVEPEEPVEEIVEDAIGDEKSICRIIYATPKFFVVSKDGKEVRFDKKNNYRRGEDIYI